MAPGAEVRAPIGPGITSNWASAAGAWPVSLTVGEELLGKVPRLSIHILVLLVKAGAALSGGLFEHLLRDLKQLGQLALGNSIAGSVVV